MPFGILAPTALCPNTNRADLPVWNYPRAGHRRECNRMLGSQRRYADREHERACRHSSVTDGRSARLCDNGLWKEMHFSFFTDTWSSQSCGDGLKTDSQVSKLLLNDALHRIRCSCGTAPKNWAKSQTRHCRCTYPA